MMYAASLPKLAILLAACASKPEPDRLVLLGDAQAAGDMAEQVAQARALLSGR